MLVKDFFTKEIPQLKKSDTISYALQVMDENKVRHLPVTTNGVFNYLIDEKSLLSCSDISRSIGTQVIESPCIMPETHILEALSYFTRFGITVLPVINRDRLYLGSITRSRMVEALSDALEAEQPGSILVLEIAPHDYSLSDMARIIEGNHAHILTLMTHIVPETGLIRVSLKIDLEDASPVIRSFERFNYTVLFHFMKKGMVDDVLQQRVNELIHFMNV